MEPAALLKRLAIRSRTILRYCRGKLKLSASSPRLCRMWTILKSSVKTVYSWLGNNWEPVVAILAVWVSVSSAWISWKGIQLSIVGLEIARLAQLDQKLANEAARKPFVTLSLDNDGMDIVLRNRGPGVARVYQTNVYFPDKIVQIGPPHGFTKFSPVVQELVLSTWSSKKITALKNTGKHWIAAGTPLGTIETNGSLTLVHLAPFAKEILDDNEMSELLIKMNIRVCSTDSVGKVYAFAFGDDQRLFEDPCVDLPGDYNQSKGRDYNGSPLSPP